MSGLYITGTDTEVGKTFVSSLLIQLLVEEKFNVIGMKPVASGAKNIGGMLQNEDALSLIAASNVDIDYKNINPYVFEQAVSPHIAAEQAGIEIDLNEIKKYFDRLQEKSDVVVVEGVGGWYAPLSDNCTVADLAESLQLPIILVVGLRLGCLNHALLTAEAIRQTGLPIAGWIANHIDNNFSFAEENVRTLKNLLIDFPYIGSVFHDLDQVTDKKNQSNSKNKNNTHDLNKLFLMSCINYKKPFV